MMCQPEIVSPEKFYKFKLVESKESTRPDACQIRGTARARSFSYTQINQIS